MTVRDDQVFVFHLTLHEGDGLWVAECPRRMPYSIFVVDLNVRFLLRNLFQEMTDLFRWILIQHENLLEVCAGMAQELEAIFLRSRQGSLVWIHHLVPVILKAS